MIKYFTDKRKQRQEEIRLAKETLQTLQRIEASMQERMKLIQKISDTAVEGAINVRVIL